MTGLEYARTICPTTSAGKDPNREDVVDAFEDGIAEGYNMHWKPSEEQMEAVRVAAEIGSANDSWAMRILKGLYDDLKKLMCYESK